MLGNFTNLTINEKQPVDEKQIKNSEYRKNYLFPSSLQYDFNYDTMDELYNLLLNIVDKKNHKIDNENIKKFIKHIKNPIKQITNDLFKFLSQSKPLEDDSKKCNKSKKGNESKLNIYNELLFYILFFVLYNLTYETEKKDHVTLDQLIYYDIRKFKECNRNLSKYLKKYGHSPKDISGPFDKDPNFISTFGKEFTYFAQLYGKSNIFDILSLVAEHPELQSDFDKALEIMNSEKFKELNSESESYTKYKKSDFDIRRHETKISIDFFQITYKQFLIFNHDILKEMSCILNNVDKENFDNLSDLDNKIKKFYNQYNSLLLNMYKYLKYFELSASSQLYYRKTYFLFIFQFFMQFNFPLLSHLSKNISLNYSSIRSTSFNFDKYINFSINKNNSITYLNSIYIDSENKYSENNMSNFNYLKSYLEDIPNFLSPTLYREIVHRFINKNDLINELVELQYQLNYLISIISNYAFLNGTEKEISNNITILISKLKKPTYIADFEKGLDILSILHSQEEHSKDSNIFFQNYENIIFFIYKDIQNRTMKTE
ncbi:hypothetical protein B5E87_05290 [Massilimicrobiota sp. An142]|uniref:hypothetical protein n=1 Tax=Massilimicrobiota sp. An142 TaxID=1965564 RepID=UPI000B3874AE|nr:hypothetical protein [Massilimicrobiota sp. An142]OUQ13736.1 hypothetical protein B5E87_05290 [Massilimicrobiota sp. An142]